MIDQARNYVGTSPTSGNVQVELLKLEGCLPEHKVLEIGCGCLHAAIPLVKYLNVGNYVGIDPNEWLRRSALEDENVLRLMNERVARFSGVDNFDSSVMGRDFDFVFAHSVLSHCAHWQMDQFLKNSRSALSHRGRILASIRLSEGNNFGSSGNNNQDSMCDEWQYPVVSWFRLETVSRHAIHLGLVPMLRPAYTRVLVSQCPAEYHDWIALCKI